MSETRVRSYVLWLLGGLVVIAVLVGFSAVLRSRSVGSTSAARSASALLPLVGDGLVVRNALPTIVEIEARPGDPFYEGRDTSSSSPQLTFSRRELGAGLSAVVGAGAHIENGYWVVAVTGVDGAPIGSVPLAWSTLAQSCSTNGSGRFATQDCVERGGWWLADVPLITGGSGCPMPAAREIGSFTDASGASHRVEVEATCAEAKSDEVGGIGAAFVTTFVVRLVPVIG